MAYQAVLVTGISDLFTSLNTFLAANGWSTDLDVANGQFAAWKNPSGAIWVTMAVQWDTAAPENVGVYQWHGAVYSTGSAQSAQTNDSGNGEATTTNSNLDNARYVDLGTGTELVDKYWVFEDTNYFHIVARYGGVAGGYRYMHFGSGYLTKYSDWTGGEYCYGQAQNVAGTQPQTSSFLLDGFSEDASPFTDMEERVATLHIEGMNDQGGTGKWAVIMGDQPSINLGTDRAAVARIHAVGGFRSGPFTCNFVNYAGSFGRGLVPMYPIAVFYWNRTTDNQEGPLGIMPDTRGVSLGNFAAEDSVTVGSDTWVVFPSHRLSTSTTVSATYTGYQGMAYKQVT